MKPFRDILNDLAGAIVKFFGAALFGSFISIVILTCIYLSEMFFFWETAWRHILWIIPVVWGILGLFWFEHMLDTGKKVFEWFFGVDG